MFDQCSDGFGTAELAGLIGALRGLDPEVDDGVRIDRIRLLEELKSAVAAAQVVETAAFAASQRAAQVALGVPAERVGRGVAGQVALARRISPFHASRYLGWAAILTGELPHTFTALQDGRVSEWRAMVVARETAGCLVSRQVPGNGTVGCWGVTITAHWALRTALAVSASCAAPRAECARRPVLDAACRYR
jgi:hypothetical protein